MVVLGSQMKVSRFYNKFDNQPKPVEIEWEALAKELCRHRIRDVPDGELWSPGSYIDGKPREAENVAELCGMVLDVDNGTDPAELRSKWDSMGLEYVVHSTYHNMVAKDRSPSVLRWRAIFPLSRTVAAKSWSRRYRALATYLADDKWDTSCSNPNRIFYLPASNSEDTCFSFHQKGRLLDPDEAPEIVFQQPASNRSKGNGKAASWVSDALEHVASDEYQTWIKVGMALKTEFGDAGWPLWEQWSKTSQKFDADVTEKKWASFHANADGQKQIVTIGSIHKMACDAGWQPPLMLAAELLDDVPPPDDEDAPGELRERAMPGPDIAGKNDWRRGLTYRTTSKGQKYVETTAGNLALLLSHTPEWAGCLGYDELYHATSWAKPPPDIPGMATPSGRLEEQHLTWVQQAARRTWGVQWGRVAVADAVSLAARCHSHHPVREYLSSLEWDRIPRLDGWLTKYHNAAPSPVAMDRWWCISAVARVYRPGCQVDHLLVLQGEQGAGKSTALRILAGQWYSGTLGDLRDKDGPQSLLGAWIIEIGELDAIRGAASTRVKDFLSQTVDRYRPTYGRVNVDRPRQCVFAGTTNEREYLHDASGARRFWPVSVGTLDRDALTRDRDQLWAEAVHYYMLGERWWPQGEEEAAALAEEAEKRFAQDPWEDAITEWLAGQAGQDLTMGEVLAAVDVERQHWGRQEAVRVASILRRAGWQKYHSREGKKWRKL